MAASGYAGVAAFEENMAGKKYASGLIISRRRIDIPCSSYAGQGLDCFGEEPRSNCDKSQE
jgi:hypothetical protein